MRREWAQMSFEAQKDKLEREIHIFNEQIHNLEHELSEKRKGYFNYAISVGAPQAEARSHALGMTESMQSSLEGRMRMRNKLTQQLEELKDPSIKIRRQAAAAQERRERERVAEEARLRQEKAVADLFEGFIQMKIAAVQNMGDIQKDITTFRDLVGIFRAYADTFDEANRYAEECENIVIPLEYQTAKIEMDVLRKEKPLRSFEYEDLASKWYMLSNTFTSIGSYLEAYSLREECRRESTNLRKKAKDTEDAEAQKRIHDAYTEAKTTLNELLAIRARTAQDLSDLAERYENLASAFDLLGAYEDSSHLANKCRDEALQNK